MEDNKLKFPGGLFERIWIVCLITGIFLKLVDVITWFDFLAVIFIWPVAVMAFTIIGIVLIAKDQNSEIRKDNKDGKDS
jgi:hypothetical protein